MFRANRAATRGRVTLAIRDEQGADAEAVRALHCAAFAGSAEADLVAALTASGVTEISLVAIEEGAVVGHILFSRLEAPMPALALAPLAVDRELRRRGIGTALVREGLARRRRKAGAPCSFSATRLIMLALASISLMREVIECPYAGLHYGAGLATARPPQRQARLSRSLHENWVTPAA